MNALYIVFALLALPTPIQQTTPVAPAQSSDSARNLLANNSLALWQTGAGKPVTLGWEVVDGVLHRVAKGGDIVTTVEYENFELTFSWKVAPGSNSGIKYRVARYDSADGKSGRTVGIEYQLLDDGAHPDGKRAKNSAGSLYDILPPSAEKTLRPVGEWNDGKIVARGNHVEHWLNGKRVVSIELDSPEFQAALAKSKFADLPSFGTRSGRLLLQEHGGEVWIKNLTIRALDVKSARR